MEAQAEPSGEATVRRSGRAQKQRLIYINGQPVLKSNNYDLEGGEPSVFDRELDRDGSAEVSAGAPGYAISYAPPVRQQQQLQRPADPRAPQPRPSKLDTKTAVHNRKMKADRQLYAARRALYLWHHSKLLQPFMSAKGFAGLQARASAAQKFVPPVPVEEQPPCIKAEMRDYQLESLRWITRMYDNGVSCILGDEMGLGKTLQTIAFLANLALVRCTAGPALVVVPLSVMSSWMSELSQWCPGLRVVRLHSCHSGEVQRLKQEVFCDPSSFDVAVTTYEMVIAKDMSGLLRAVDWRVLVLDEGHRIKNENTLLAGGLRNVRHQFCLLLTGTPLQNNLHEFYALLSFLLPDVFDDSAPFDSAFDLQHNRVDNAQLDRAHHLTKLLILRRTKASVNLHLPPKLETRIACPLSEMQLFWYQRLLMKNSAPMLRMLGSSTSVPHDEESTDWKKLQSLLMQLRKCVNHPYQFPGAEPDFDGASTGEDIVEASGKLTVLDKLLGKLKAGGHRVVVFSQFNLMLDIIEDYLQMRGYSYRRLDGSTNRVKRKIDISVFNRPASPIFIYIINTRAGGLGINLQTADTAILFDSDWNPQVDVQAMARVHRIGQTRPVHIYRLFSANTVEERVLLRADKKLFLDKMVNRDEGGSSAASKEGTGLGMSEMLSAIQFGADRIFQGDKGRMPSDKELDAIIDRSGPGEQDEVKICKEGQAPAPLCLQGAKLSAAEFVESGVQQAPLSSYLLNGTDYSKYRGASMKDLAEEWQASGAKRQSSSTTVVIDGHVVSKSSIRDQQKLAAWAAASAPKQKKSKQRLVEFSHSSYCQHCWEAGELFLCDYCPAAYHAHCLGRTRQEMLGMKIFSCPHHTCVGCDRKAGAAGGLLLACEGCSNSYCEDCLPDDAEIVDVSERFENLEFRKPSTLCYIRCDSLCQEYCARPGFNVSGVHGVDPLLKH
mmetsp:Transcript_15446/g.43214  ORF Transcript_15446/g.43214 Transcript_15446/m.43214 type:complete len:946 (+) Transcript_15446:412-3249(+)